MKTGTRLKQHTLNVVGTSTSIEGPSTDKSRVTTALLLAAGTGSRLHPLTADAPKCLTVVGGKPILERLVENLRAQGITKLVVVTGYLDACIRQFLGRTARNIKVEYVFNPDYRTTNNIYSLWLAKHAIQESFLLVECDLVFDVSMLDDMLVPNKIAISNILPWMNGTTVELEDEKNVVSFHVGHDIDDAPRYKTVNMYSLSLSSWQKVVERLAAHISNGQLGEYYEAVFAEMVADNSLSFDAVFFKEDEWYEVDKMDDLIAAELLFSMPDTLETPEVAKEEPSEREIEVLAIVDEAVGTGSPE